MKSSAVFVLLFCLTFGLDATLGQTTAAMLTANTSQAPNNTAPPKVQTTTNGLTPKPQSTAHSATTSPNTEVQSTVPLTTVGPATETVNTYKVKKGNVTCLMAKFKGHFTNEKKTWHIANYTMLNDSSCGNLSVQFGSGLFRIEFNQTKDKAFYISSVHATLDAKTTIKTESVNLTLAKASNGSSYMCLSGLNISMSQGISFMMSEVQLQAFWVGEGKFATALQCTGDYSDNLLVPIVVGCALGGLIVIVLLAYCIVRSRVNRDYNPVENTI